MEWHCNPWVVTWSTGVFETPASLASCSGKVLGVLPLLLLELTAGPQLKAANAGLPLLVEGTTRSCAMASR